MKAKTAQIIAEHLFEGHSCKNCGRSYKCKLHPKHSVCAYWKEETLIEGMLRAVRLVYPNVVANELVSVQPMQTNDDDIKYITYSYNDDLTMDIKDDGLTLNIKEDDQYQVSMDMAEWMDKIEQEEKDKIKYNTKETLNTLLKNQKEYLEKLDEERNKDTDS